MARCRQLPDAACGSWTGRGVYFVAVAAIVALTSGCHVGASVPSLYRPVTNFIPRGAMPDDGEPTWVTVRGVASPAVPQVTPIASALAKPAPPDGVDVVAKDQAVSLVPPQVTLEPSTPLPAASAPATEPRAIHDDSIVLVGGVPIVLPPVATTPAAEPNLPTPFPTREGGEDRSPLAASESGVGERSLGPEDRSAEGSGLPSIPAAPLPLPVPPGWSMPFDSRWYRTNADRDGQRRTISVHTDPVWQPLPSAAFFTDSPLPVTQTRLRWDYGSHLIFPDRGEYFWARADGRGRGPSPNPPARGTPYLDYHELYLDQEFASGPLSATIAVPYRFVDPCPWASCATGFGDMQITAKGLLFDNERFLLALQVRSYLPVGSYRNGIGTGHATLEPGLIAGVRLDEDTFALGQIEEWIPLAGDRDYTGSALRYHFALNQVLWRPAPDVQLIGTGELTGFGFQDGAYTDPVSGQPQQLSGQSALSLGIGGRLFVSDKWDVGTGWAHAISGKYLMRDQLRVEFRCRY